MIIDLVERRDARRIVVVVVVLVVVFVWVAAIMMIRSLRSRPLDSGSLTQSVVDVCGVACVDKMIDWLVGKRLFWILISDSNVVSVATIIYTETTLDER